VTTSTKPGYGPHDGRWRLLFWVGFSLAWGFAPAGYAQQNASDWDGSGQELQCVPSCRSGYECTQGECTPICSPACGPGHLCSAGGSCVRIEAPAPRPVQTWSASPNQCLPSCRKGYVCISGQCVTACNPACPMGEMCTEHGECVPGSAEPQESTAETAAEGRSSSADSIVNLHFDALGLLQFGLTPTLEIGKRFSGYLRLRPMNTGLSSYFLLAPDEDEFIWGLGAALGMHVFSAKAGNMRGVFGGPSLEYAFVQTKNMKQDYARYGTHVLVPELDLGYRWAFDSFLLGLGGRIGLSIPVGSHDEPIGESGCRRANSCDDERDLWFVAGAFVDLGWFL
jgi:hypothetical protein